MPEEQSPPTTPTPAPAEATTPASSDAVVVPPAKKSSNKVLYIVLGVILVFFVLPGIALGIGLNFLASKASDKIAEKGVESIISSATGGAVDVNSKDGSFSVSSKDGDSSMAIGGDQKLPDDFPKSDIPYLKEAGVTAVFTSTSEGKKTWSVTTTTDKSFVDAKNYFESRVKAPEYTDVATYGFGNSQTYYGKGSNYNVSITVSAGEDGAKTSVSYIIAQEK